MYRTCLVIVSCMIHEASVPSMVLSPVSFVILAPIDRNLIIIGLEQKSLRQNLKERRFNQTMWMIHRFSKRSESGP